MSAKLAKSAIGFAAGFLALAPLASAALYTFQDGLNGYDGTQDNTLYAGDPGINVGASPTLLARGDHRAILSFDLTSLAGMTVTGNATLTLTMADNHVNVPFSVYAISDANAGWQQGDNTAYGSAGAGESTYEDFSYPNIPWVGGDALEGTGGYNHTAEASGVGGAYNTTVDLTLPASLIQHWIDVANGGLLVNSDTYYTQIQFRSSDDTAGRPMLKFTAVPEPGTLSVLGLMASTLILGRRRK